MTNGTKLAALLLGAALMLGVGATASFAAEGKCGDAKKEEKAAKCGGEKEEKAGKCGAGKCGSTKATSKCGDAKKAGKCGAEDKEEKAGKCGDN